MHMNVRAAPLSEHNPAVGPALGAAIARAIEKDPAARHASMKAFQEALVTAITVKELRAPGSGVTLSSSGRTGPITAGTTTLSANAGELEGGTDPDVVVTPRRGRAGIVAALVIVLGVAGAFTARALRPPGANPAPGPLTTGVPTPTGPGRTAEPPPEDRAVKPPPPPQPQPARTTIDIATAPAQARLLDAGDGHLLGTSPWHGELPSSSGELKVRIEKAGYKSQTISIPLGQAFNRTFELERARAGGRRGGGASGERIIKL